MKISCPKCPAVYELDESRIPAAGLSIKCPKCQTPFTVAKPKVDAVVPLPGSGAPRPPAPQKQAAAPSAPPPGRPPGAQGAVPLPGAAGLQRKASPVLAPPAVLAPPPPAQPPVPLPGQSGGRAIIAPPPPPSAPITPPPPAVPLPGAQGAKARAAAKPVPPAAQPPPSLMADPFADLEMNLSDTSLDMTPPVMAPPPPALAPQPPPRAAIAPPPPAPPEDDPFGLDLPPAPGEAAAPPPAPSAPPPPPAMKPKPMPPLLPDDGGLSFDFIDDKPPALAPSAKKPTPPAGSELLDFVDDDAGAGKPAPESQKPRPTAQQGSRPPPPVMSAPGAPPVLKPGATVPVFDKTTQDEKPVGARPAKKPREPIGPKLAGAIGPLGDKLAAARDFASHNRKLVGAGVGGLALVVLIGLGIRAGSTSSGLFWMHKLMPRSLATSSGRRAVEAAAEKLNEGNFLATRSALGVAAQVMQASPDDDDVRAFFVLCASELKLMYGQAGVDWDVAQHTVGNIKSEGPRAARARAAFSLALGDATRAKALLQPLIDRGAAESEGIFLYAQALIRLKDLKGAATALDNALKIGHEPPGKLLLTRAMVSRAQGNLPEAATFLEQTLVRQPGSGRALIELADVKRVQDDPASAMALLEKALLPDTKKALDATEEARALLLRGQILAAQRQYAGAETAFERAVELDPQSVEIRATYGAWRAGRHEYDKALKHLEVALGRDPQNPAVIDAAARSYIGIGKPLDASKRIGEGLKKTPDDPTLLFLQGKVDEQFAKPDEAFKNYEAALKKKPDHAESLVASGFYLLNVKNDRPAAEKRLQLAVASPDGARSAVVHLAIGDLFLALGDATSAKDHYRKALDLEPDDAQAHASMGRALAAMGDTAEARRELELALKTLESDPQLLYDYGSLLRRVGDRAAAMGPLSKAVKLSGNVYQYRSRLGALLFEQGDLDGAEKELRQAALLSDKWSETCFFLGRVLAAKKRLPESIEQHKKAIELEPGRAEFHYWLGVAYESTSQIGDAIRSFAGAIERDPKLVDAYEHMGKDYMLQNVYDEAMHAFAKAVALAPARPELAALLGDAEQQAGEADKAIEHYKQALAKNPTLHGVWSKLGIAFKDKNCNGCRATAVQAFLRAEQYDPTDPQARRELGYVYKEDGKRAEAVVEFKKYIELKPDAPDADQVRDDIYYLSEEKKRSP